MSRMEDRFEGKCSKHGYWTSNTTDDCPKCIADDYHRECDDEARWMGICATCKYFNYPERVKCCSHPKRRKYPCKPRKRKCYLYAESPPDYGDY